MTLTREIDVSPSNPVDTLHEIADAYLPAQVLFLAQTDGLFPLLETPMTAPDAAAQLGWATRPARGVLDALAGLGLVIKSGDEYRNGDLASACLAPGRPGYLGDYVQHMATVSTRWSQLGKCLCDGKPAVRGYHPGDSTTLADFARAMDALARTNAPAFFDAIDLTGCRRLLDIGGGLGAYIAEAMRRYPELHATLFEHPAVASLNRDSHHLIAPTDNFKAVGPPLNGDCPCLSWRWRVLAGNALKDDLGTDYDVVIMANVLHAYGPEDCQRLLNNVYRALALGGRLLLRDFFTDAEGAGPPAALLFGLHMFLHSDAGDGYLSDTVTGWLQEVGFAEIEELTLGRATRLLVAKKPCS